MALKDMDVALFGIPIVVISAVDPGECEQSLFGSPFVIEEAGGSGPGTPIQDKLMRHGTWFGSGIKQKMWWAK